MTFEVLALFWLNSITVENIIGHRTEYDMCCIMFEAEPDGSRALFIIFLM